MGINNKGFFKQQEYAYDNIINLELINILEICL